MGWTLINKYQINSLRVNFPMKTENRRFFFAGYKKPTLAQKRLLFSVLTVEEMVKRIWSRGLMFKTSTWLNDRLFVKSVLRIFPHWDWIRRDADPGFYISEFDQWVLATLGDLRLKVRCFLVVALWFWSKWNLSMKRCYKVFE